MDEQEQQENADDEQKEEERYYETMSDGTIRVRWIPAGHQLFSLEEK